MGFLNLRKPMVTPSIRSTSGSTALIPGCLSVFRAPQHAEEPVADRHEAAYKRAGRPLSGWGVDVSRCRPMSPDVS